MLVQYELGSVHFQTTFQKFTFLFVQRVIIELTLLGMQEKKEAVFIT